jgi:hypothetical protein
VPAAPGITPPQIIFLLLIFVRAQCHGIAAAFRPPVFQEQRPSLSREPFRSYAKLAAIKKMRSSDSADEIIGL